jgi:hypothetical protein
MRVTESLQQLITVPIADTLNIKNGMNYA